MDIVSSVHLMLNGKIYLDNKSVISAIKYFMEQGIGGVRIGPQHLPLIEKLNRVPNLYLSVDHNRGLNDTCSKLMMMDYYWGRYGHKLAGIDCFPNSHHIYNNDLQSLKDETEKLFTKQQIPINICVDLQFFEDNFLESYIRYVTGFVTDKTRIILGNSRLATENTILFSRKHGSHFGVFGNFSNESFIQAMKNKIDPICLSINNINQLFEME